MLSNSTDAILQNSNDLCYVGLVRSKNDLTFLNETYVLLTAAIDGVMLRNATEIILHNYIAFQAIFLWHDNDVKLRNVMYCQ